MGPRECLQSGTDLVGPVRHNRAVLVLRHTFVMSFLQPPLHLHMPRLESQTKAIIIILTSTLGPSMLIFGIIAHGVICIHKGCQADTWT